MAKGIKRTHNEFVEVVNIVHNNRVDVLSEYLAARKRIEVRCKVCNHSWNPIAYSLSIGNGCSKCRNNKFSNDRTMSHEEFINKLTSKRSNILNEIEIMSEYIRAFIPIKCKCLICSFIWNPTPNKLMIGRGCPKCGGSLKKTHSEFIDDLLIKVPQINERIEIIGTYKTMQSVISCKCKICNETWNPIANNLLRGQGCPKCNEPKGQIRICNYLDKLKIKYETEARFDNCKFKRKLPFDTYINNLVLVEYDGEQHFKMFYKFRNNRNIGQKNLNYVQNNDKIKNKYCTENNIPLIRIPYWEYNNIENILDHVLGYYKLTDKQDVDNDLLHKYLVNHESWSHEKYLEQANRN